MTETDLQNLLNICKQGNDLVIDIAVLKKQIAYIQENDDYLLIHIPGDIPSIQLKNAKRTADCLVKDLTDRLLDKENQLANLQLPKQETQRYL